MHPNPTQSHSHVLLFGLSADPPTGLGGHLGLVQWALDRESFPELGGRLDKLWIIPVYRHAFESKRDQADFAHRLEMCRLAFNDKADDRVEVLDIERTLSESNRVGRVSSYQLVKHLKSKSPGCKFGLLLGADTARDLAAGRWYSSQELLSEVTVLVVRREGVTKPDLPSNMIWIEDAPALSNVSSTAVRAIRDVDRLSEYVTPEVAAYIAKNRLYGACS